MLDKYGDSDEAETKIAREMGWERELTEEEAEEERQRIEEMNRACEEALHEPPPEPDPHLRASIGFARRMATCAIRFSTVASRAR